MKIIILLKGCRRIEDPAHLVPPSLFTSYIIGVSHSRIYQISKFKITRPTNNKTKSNANIGCRPLIYLLNKTNLMGHDLFVK